MTRKYGAKKDANHNAIVAVLEAGGCSTIDISSTGHGLPDIIVHHPVHGTQLAEIKNRNTSYGRRGANKNQIAWASAWPLPVYLLASEEDAEKFVAGKLDELEKYGGIVESTAEEAMK